MKRHVCEAFRPLWFATVSSCCAALAACMLIVGVTVASASSGVPWWHVQQVSVPTRISPAAQRGEEQQIVVTDASPGEANPLFEIKVEDKVVAIFGEHEAIKHEEGSAANVQRALEAGSLQAAGYGPGNVEVTGGPAGSSPLVVKSVGASIGRTVAPIEAVGFFGVSASTKVTQAGAPAGTIVLRATDVGDGPIEGKHSPVTVADVLPAGLQAVGISGTVRGWHRDSEGNLEGGSLGYGAVTCSLSELSCTDREDSLAFNLIEVTIPVIFTEQSTPSGPNSVSVSGGGAPSLKRSQQVTVSEMPVPFGIEPGSFEMTAEEEDGKLDARAGSHPFQLTTAFTFNNTGEGGTGQPAQPRNTRFLLPPGLVGNAQLMPRCKLTDFVTIVKASDLCPPDTAVGVALEAFSAQRGNPVINFIETSVYNLEPGPGEPARLGFMVEKDPVYLTTSVRTGADYGVTVDANNITELAAFSSSLVTLWGSPNNPVHNSERGGVCLSGLSACEESLGLPQTPFLTLPDSCEEAFPGVMEANSWTLPEYLGPIVSASTETLTACNKIPFEPSVEVSSESQSSSGATGLIAHVKLPQAIDENAEALGEGTIKDTTVALPAGVMLNPADAEKLQACSEQQIGLLSEPDGTPRHGSHGEILFTSKLPEGWEEGEGGFCPRQSKIGEVAIHTPLLNEAVKGAAYLATPAPNGEPGLNPFNGLVAMYIVAEAKQAGVAVKLPGRVTLCQGAGEVIEGIACGAQGQLISTFDDTPQLPFEDLELHFFGGPKSPLSTPAHCDAYTTQAVFTPWSGGAPVDSSSMFEITSGPGGTTCPGTILPFDPSLTAGATNIQAGAFSPFSTTISREDGNQDVQAVTLHTPPGLSGLLTGVKLCGEAQANAGTCGPESLIGGTLVSVGVGGDPYTVTGGKVYLTEKYGGAPFGLSIVNPADAGPFHLGSVIVRAKIEVDPVTAALTVSTDQSGPYRIPQYIDGIPLQIKHINVTIDRPGFTFNPTDCDRMQITGSVSGHEGGVSTLAVPFQVTDCAALAFKPSFKVSVSGKASRANGTSLRVKLTYPSAPFGSQANIHYVKVNLPKQLPSELKTLQHACPHEVFEADPASCPSPSRVGYARATTPLLPVALEGPAYFVSYGGQKFPELIVVLQGYGVTVDLHGETFINEKTGITSSTFHEVPDVPVGSFELTLPAGPFSALGANGNLCEFGRTVTVSKRVRRRVHGRPRTVTVKVKRKKPALAMPTAFVAQNGAQIHTSTPIAVSGCAHVPARGKAGKARRARAGRRGGK